MLPLPRRYGLVLVAALIGVALEAPAARGQVDPGFRLYVEPSELVIPGDAEAAAATIILTNGSATPLKVRLRVSEPYDPATGQIGKATIDGSPDVTVPGIAPVTPGANRAEVRIVFSGIRPPNVYHATLEALGSGAEPLELAVRMASPPLTVAVAGATKAGVIRLVPASELDLQFTVRLANPAGGVERTFALAVQPQPSGPDGPLQVGLDPESFKLAPGQEEPVRITLAAAPADSMYRGALVVSDAGVDGIQQVFDLEIERSYSVLWVPFAIGALVLLGSVLSTVVNLYLPFTVEKRRNQRALRQQRGRIAYDLREGTPYQIDLSVDRRKLEIQNRSTAWYSARARELLTEVTAEIGALVGRVDLAEGFDRFRERVNTSIDIPPSVMPDILDLMWVGEAALVRKDLEVAKTKLAEAEGLASLKGSEAQVRQALEREIGDLKEAVDEPYLDALRAELVARLEAIQTGKVPHRELLDLDQSGAAITLYRRFQQRIAVRDPDKAAPRREQLLRELKSGDAGLLRAQMLYEQFESATDIDDITAAIQKQEYRIAVRPLVPGTGFAAQFEFRFDDERLDYSPLAQRLQYRWDFGDGTSPSLGKRCIHFFPEGIFPRKPGAMGRLAASIRARLAPGARAKPDAYRRTQAVAVTVSDGSRTIAETTSEVSVARTTTETGLDAVRNVELWAFGLSYLVAFVLALTFHYTDDVALSSWNDWVTPFLWGFGLDQVKDKATNFTELMKRMPQETTAPGGG